MNYRNAAVVTVLASVMAGCAYMPTGHSSRSGHGAGQGQISTNKTDELFSSDKNAPVAESSGVNNSVSTDGLRVRKSKRGNMESYVVRGQRYFTLANSDGYSARGLASWYGPNFHGRTASNGEVYDMYKMTAAHKTLPLPTYARVTHLDNGKTIIVKINDRGPFSGDRIIDLSFAAALELGMVNDGTAMVEIQALSPEELVVLSGPENKLGVDFYYDSGPVKAESLPVSELFVPDAELKVKEARIEDQIQAPVIEVPASNGLAVPVEPVVVEVADAALPAEGTALDVAALDGEFIEVVVPGRERVAGDAETLATAGDELLTIEQQEAVAMASVQVTPEIPESQQVPVTLTDSAGLGQSLPVSGVPAMMTAGKSEPVSEFRYYIQAGVFADVLDAEKVAVDIVLEIPSEEVHVKPLKGSQMYRITVGPIVTNDHARQVAQRLNTAGIENYTVKVKEI